MGVDLGPGPDLFPQGWTTLFQSSSHYLYSYFSQYDVHPDGDRFLVVRSQGVSDDDESELVVVVNWFRQMEERMRSAVGG